MKLCECGCGNEVKLGNKRLNGHGARGAKRTDEQKEHYRESFTTERRSNLSKRYKENNPMKREDVKDKFRGDKNPAKRADVRQKISDNNSMLHQENIEKIRNSKGWQQNNIDAGKRWTENNPSKNKELLEKRIDTYTKRLAAGEYSIKNNWKTGWFAKSDGTKEWFDSSLEESQMSLYESQKLVWTKKHKIRIPYTNSSGISTYYVPDFLVTTLGGIFLDETKGWIKPVDKQKAKLAIEFCKQKGWIYRFYLNHVLIPELSSDQTEITIGK